MISTKHVTQNESSNNNCSLRTTCFHRRIVWVCNGYSIHADSSIYSSSTHNRNRSEWNTQAAMWLGRLVFWYWALLALVAHYKYWRYRNILCVRQQAPDSCICRGIGAHHTCKRDGDRMSERKRVRVCVWYVEMAQWYWFVCESKHVRNRQRSNKDRQWFSVLRLLYIYIHINVDIFNIMGRHRNMLRLHCSLCMPAVPATWLLFLTAV